MEVRSLFSNKPREVFVPKSPHLVSKEKTRISSFSPARSLAKLGKALTKPREKHWCQPLESVEDVSVEPLEHLFMILDEVEYEADVCNPNKHNRRRRDSGATASTDITESSILSLPDPVNKHRVKFQRPQEYQTIRSVEILYEDDVRRCWWSKEDYKRMACQSHQEATEHIDQHIGAVSDFLSLLCLCEHAAETSSSDVLATPHDCAEALTLLDSSMRGLEFALASKSHRRTHVQRVLDFSRIISPGSGVDKSVKLAKRSIRSSRAQKILARVLGDIDEHTVKEIMEE